MTLEEVIARLEEAAGRLRAGALAPEEAAARVEECALAAAEGSAELERLARAAASDDAPTAPAPGRLV